MTLTIGVMFLVVVRKWIFYGQAQGTDRIAMREANWRGGVWEPSEIWDSGSLLQDIRKLGFSSNYFFLHISSITQGIFNYLSPFALLCDSLSTQE